MPIAVGQRCGHVIAGLLHWYITWEAGREGHPCPGIELGTRDIPAHIPRLHTALTAERGQVAAGVENCLNSITVVAA